MQIRTFTIPIHDDGGWVDEMNRFLRSHRVLEVEREFDRFLRKNRAGRDKPRP